MAVPSGLTCLDGGGRNHDVAEPAGVLFVDAGAAREPHDEDPGQAARTRRVQCDEVVIVRGRFGAVDSVVEIPGGRPRREDAALPVIGTLLKGGEVAIGGGEKRRGNHQQEGKRRPGDGGGEFFFFQYVGGGAVLKASIMARSAPCSFRSLVRPSSRGPAVRRTV